MRRSDETTDSDRPRCRRFRVDFDKMSRLTRWMASNTPIVVYYPFPTLYVMLEHVSLIKLSNLRYGGKKDRKRAESCR